MRQFNAKLIYANGAWELEAYDSIEEAQSKIYPYRNVFKECCGCPNCEAGESYYLKSVEMTTQSSADINTLLPFEFRWKRCDYPPGELRKELWKDKKWKDVTYTSMFSEGEEPLRFRNFIDNVPLDEVLDKYKNSGEIWWDNQTIPWDFNQ